MQQWEQEMKCKAEERNKVWEQDKKEDQVRRKVLEEMWRDEWDLKMENEEKEMQKVWNEKRKKLLRPGSNLVQCFFVNIVGSIYPDHMKAQPQLSN